MALPFLVPFYRLSNSKLAFFAIFKRYMGVYQKFISVRKAGSQSSDFRRTGTGLYHDVYMGPKVYPDPTGGQLCDGFILASCQPPFS